LHQENHQKLSRKRQAINKAFQAEGLQKKRQVYHHPTDTKTRLRFAGDPIPNS